MELRTKNSHVQQEDALDEEQASLIQFLDSTIKLKRKKYKSISDATRKKLIHLTKEEGMSVKKVAKKLRINYSTAKSICKTFMKEGRIGKRATVSAAKSTKRKEVPRGESSGEEVSGKFAPQEKPKKKSTAPVACKSEEVEVESVRKESSLKEKTQEGGQGLALPSMPGLKPLASVSQFRVPSAETLDNQLATPSLKLEPNSQLLAQLQLAQMSKLGSTNSQLPMLAQSLFQNHQAYQLNALLNSKGNATAQSIYSLTAVSPIVQPNVLTGQIRAPTLPTNYVGMTQNWNSVLSPNVGTNTVGTGTPLTAYTSQIHLQNITLMNLLRNAQSTVKNNM